MTIKQTKLLTKQELNNYINKLNYKSIEVIESCTKNTIESLKQQIRSDKVTLVVINKWRILTRLVILINNYYKRDT